MAQRYNFTAQTNLGNVADPALAQDAATKNYVDTHPGNQGTVRYVSLTAPPALVVGGVPITDSGTITLAWSTNPPALIPVANLGSGAASATTFLRGDGTWAVPSGSGTGLTSVGLVVPAAFAIQGSPLTQNGNMTLTWSTSPAGLVPTANLGTGTATASTFLRGDGSWAVPPGTAGTVTQVLANNGITVSPATAGAATYTVGLLGNTVFSATGAPGTVAGARTGDIYLQLGDRGATQPWYGILGTYKYNGTSWDTYAQAGVATGQSTPFTPLPGSLTQVPYYGIYWQHDGDSTKRFVSLWRREGLSGTASDYVQYYPPSLDTVVGSGGLASSGVTLKQITVGLLQVAGNATDSTINIGSSSLGNYRSILIQNVTAGSDMVIQILMPTTGTVSSKHRFTARGQLPPIPTAGQDFVIDLGLNSRVVRLFAESGFMGGSTGSDGNSADPAISVQLENPLNFTSSKMGGIVASTNDVLSWNGSNWTPRAVSTGTGTVTSVSLNAPPPFNVTVPTVTTQGTLTFTWGTGQVPTANLGAGVANTSTFLRGDGNWFAPGFVSSISLSVPTGFAITGSPGTGAAALAITYSGQIPPTSLGTGTPTVNNYLRGDGSWQPAVSSVAKQAGTQRNGAIRFIEGDNITITDNGDGSFTFNSSGGGGGGAFTSISAIWSTAGAATKTAYALPSIVNDDGITITMVAVSNPGALVNATVRLNNVNLINTYPVVANFPNYTIIVPVADLLGNAIEIAPTVDVVVIIGTQYFLTANDLTNILPTPFNTVLSAFYTQTSLPYYTTTATVNWAYSNSAAITAFGGSITIPGATAISCSTATGSLTNQLIVGGTIGGQATGNGINGAGSRTVVLSGTLTAVTTFIPAFYTQTINSTAPSFTTSSSQTPGAAVGSTITYPVATAATQYNWIATTLPINRLFFVTPLGNSPLVADVTAPTQTISGQTFNVFGVTSLTVGAAAQIFISAS